MRNKIPVVIVCAFLATTLAFLGASVASFVLVRQIDRETANLLGNALPSVRELTRARTALRELRTEARAELAQPPPRHVEALERQRQELDAALARETGTPWYPGERRLFGDQVAPALDEVGAALADFERQAAAPRGDPALARAGERLTEATDAADDAVANLLDLNREQGVAAAERIVATRTRFEHATLYLEVGATVVALLMAILAIEVALRFERVMRRNVQLEAERAQELDLVAQRVAHDLMSPLAAVSLSLSIVQRKHRDDDTTRAVQRAQRVLDRSRHMVQGIYAFAKSSAHPSSEAAAPLRATVLAAAGALQGLEGEEFPTVDVQPFEDVEVSMERSLLDVVLSNLLSNAAKHTVGSPVRRVTVRADVEPRRVHVEVQDTGPGVPEGCEALIFEPYRRAPGVVQPGLGLGLATVKRLVEGHGGAVGVRNAPSGGAVFWFELPRAPRPAPAPEPADGEQHPPPPSGLHPRPAS